MESIWIVAHDPATGADLAAGARGLASFVGAVSIGGGAIPGADVTVTAPVPGGGELIEGYARPIAALLAEEGAGAVLFGTDTQSRALAGAVAAHLKTAVHNASGITAEAGGLRITRSVYGGLAQAEETLTGKVAVLVVGAGVLPAADVAPVTGTTRTLDGEATTGMKVIGKREKTTQAVNLGAAKKVVGVGRGFAAQADLELARALAAKLDAELACSRPMAEGVDWMPVERYLGVSGATIRPDVYVAVGISGQVQHMVGVNRAKTIVAINTDKNAPIFSHADYGIVGDLYQVLPALTAAL